VLKDVTDITILKNSVTQFESANRNRRHRIEVIQNYAELLRPLCIGRKPSI